MHPGSNSLILHGIDPDADNTMLIILVTLVLDGWLKCYCRHCCWCNLWDAHKLAVQNVANTITGEEKVVSDEILDAEKYLEGIEKQYGSQLPQWLNWGPFKALFGQGSGNYGAAK